MNTLPQIDYQEVAKSLAADIGNLKFQLAQMENLATQLRNERDSYKTRLDGLAGTASDASVAGEESVE